ncbi:MAG: hypothetical protein RSG96_07110, partial [Clostridia bacterium]
FDCNVAMINVGGVTSFYPTELAYQDVSPYLKPGEDKVAEIVDKCRAAGIRVIGRFDFNRAHERFYADHPEWFYHDKDQRLLRCNDTVTTCLNSWYQQQYSMEILREALERYALDGIFFNGFGFASWDYHGNHFGPCHCESCQKRFAEFSGGCNVPDTDAPSEPAHAPYEAFKRHCIAEMLRKITDFAHSYSPEIAVCTYSTDGVDIVRNESNCGIGRPYPFTLMQSSTNVAQIRHTHPGMVVGNCVINATDLRWRYSGVPHELTDIRLYEDIAAGGSLDFCINGVFEDYPDKGSVENAKEVFRYHKRNEGFYGCLASQARIALVQPSTMDANSFSSPDREGVFRALKEEHLLFDIQLDTALLADENLRQRYELFMIPEALEVNAALLPLLYLEERRTIALGATASLGQNVESVLGIAFDHAQTDNAGAYLWAREKDIFTHFADKEWVFLTDSIGFFTLADGWWRLLPY